MKDWWMIPVAAAALGLIWLFCWCQNNRMSHSSYAIRSRKISAPIRIVHLSDLHTKDFGGRLLKKVAAEKPDVIFITGDLIGRYARRYGRMYRLVAELCLVAPVYYVSGNHEYARANREEIFRFVAQSGATVLRHRSWDMTVRGQKLHIMGLDEGGYRVQTPAVLEEFAREEGFKILLSHFTERFSQEYCHYDIDLTFTGHSHGGQFIFPLIGGVFAPGQGLFPKYYKGIHEIEGSTQVISRGMGNSGFPLRLFNHPEYITVDLLPEK
ncbi:MAG: metallophosphoesterase [Christensenellaceae bacterium]|nr:metallophosphoesterase [Christensenellaceae bacterium]